MAKASPYDLNYGHFGQAIYSIEHGSWMFDREPVQRGVLRQVGFWRPVIEKGTREIDSNLLEDAIRVNEVRHAAKVLARDNCELFPALEVLPDLALASAAVTSTAATYDPAVGDLLSFGSFTAAEGQSRPARRIVAVPTGEAGNILRLIPLVKQRQGWGRDKSFWLEISSFSDTENAYWADEAGPIQQLCFARSEARSAFLAVRFPTKTILFRPVMHQQRKSASRSRFYNLPASRVEPHPVVSIACDKTGGFSHADVTFNPDYQRQFGIVDRMGNWSVWDIEGGQRGSGYSITAVTAGLIAPESGIEDQEAHTREDGWARILWIGDVNTIIVCNRRRLQLYGLKGGETMPLDTFQPVPDHSPHWILDIRKDPTNSRQLFVLTSSHLFLLAVICQNDAIGNDEVVPGAGVVLSWAHFRGLDDITLQLHVPLLTGEEGCKVFLFSRLNSLITVYHFGTHEAEASRPFSSSDPVTFPIDGLLSPSQTAQWVIGLHLEPVALREGDRQHGTGPGSTYSRNMVAFYRLCVMLSDHSVHQAVFYALPRASDDGSPVVLDVEAPTWTAVTLPKTLGLHAGQAVENDDDFVIENGLETQLVPDLKLPYRTRRTGSRRLSLSSNSEFEEDPGLASFEYVYGTLAQSALLETADHGSEGVDVSEIIARTKALLEESPDGAETSGKTLLESTQAVISKVLDVDDASAQLHNLFGYQSPRSLGRIASNQVLQWANDEEAHTSISSLYDALLESWIAPLPTYVPGRIRQNKERLARRIAAEVTLANSRISEPASPEIQSGAPLGAVPESQHPLSLPSSPLPVEPFPRHELASRPPSSSVPPPNTTLFATHSNAVARLAQHLEITKAPPAVSPNVGQVLMHWVPGQDPSTYDWAATTRAVEDELGIARDDDEQSQKERDKLKRKAERLLKRQRRELDLERRNAESQPMPALRSSPPPIVGLGMSSQTQAPTQTQDSSQAFNPFGFGVVQSQVEPGRHGGKPAIKKKKKGKGKGRISGF